jgi:hypothetical protein
MARGICVAHSETLLRLAREKGEGLVEWDRWRRFTAAPDTDEVPGADPYEKYSVSGSRFMRIDIGRRERWALIRVYDLSHWTRPPNWTVMASRKRKRCGIDSLKLEIAREHVGYLQCCDATCT